jgi:hypothetical protein
MVRVIRLAEKPSHVDRFLFARDQRFAVLG